MNAELPNAELPNVELPKAENYPTSNITERRILQNVEYYRTGGRILYEVSGQQGGLLDTFLHHETMLMWPYDSGQNPI